MRVCSNSLAANTHVGLSWSKCCRSNAEISAGSSRRSSSLRSRYLVISNVLTQARFRRLHFLNCFKNLTVPHITKSKCTHLDLCQFNIVCNNPLLWHRFGPVITVFSAAASVINRHVDNGQVKHPTVCGRKCRAFYLDAKKSQSGSTTVMNQTFSTTESRTVGLCGEVHTHAAASHLHPRPLRLPSVHRSDRLIGAGNTLVDGYSAFWSHRCCRSILWVSFFL